MNPMPSLITLRVRPDAPTEGPAFAEYFGNLTIVAFDLAVNEPAGVQIGEAQYVPPPT